MNQKCYLTWFQSLLKREQPILLDESNWFSFVSEVLDVICCIFIDKSQLKDDIFQRQQIQSIIELLQKLVSILKNFNENSINELLKFIFLVSREIPEIELLTQQIDDMDQEQLLQEINLPDNQIIQLSFSKYELLQIIEHVEEKYKQSKEQLLQIQSQMQKTEENLKLSIISKEEENRTLNKCKQRLYLSLEIEELITEIDRLNLISVEQQKIIYQTQEQQYYNSDQTQLLQYLQRQQSVIQEQEHELQELRKVFPKKQMNNRLEEKENYNNIQTLENKVFLYSEKLKELNQQVQIQRTETVRLEIQKSLVEKKLEDTIQQKDEEIQKLKFQIDEIQKQNQKIQSEITARSKVISIHSQSSKHLLAQELQESHLNMQNLEKNSTDVIQTNTGDMALMEEQYQAEKEQYHEIISNFMNDLKRQEKIIYDLQKENKQIQQNYQHLLKIKYEACNVTYKIKKIELQNDLLKKIVDAFLQTNFQS